MIFPPICITHACAVIVGSPTQMGFLAITISCLGVSIHVSGPDERKIEFGDGVNAMATLSGGTGYINSTVNFNAPDFITQNRPPVVLFLSRVREHGPLSQGFYVV